LLRDTYRVQLMRAALHEGAIKALVVALRAAGVEAVLFKGWAAARLYPEAALRPHGDVDLWVLPEQVEAAERVLAGVAAGPIDLDFHRRLYYLDDRSEQEISRRSLLVPLEEIEVRVLGWEDHLRLLCLHLLKHGLRRASALCDVALMVEQVPADFDWEYFRWGDQPRTRAAACVIGLAEQLLGTQVPAGAVIRRGSELPRWLVTAVLRQWGVQFSSEPRELMVRTLRRPGAIPGAFLARWPSPIEVSYEWRLPFNDLPRAPFQAAWCCYHGLRWVGSMLTGAELRQGQAHG
jgi:hypothetical protein